MVSIGTGESTSSDNESSPVMDDQEEIEIPGENCFLIGSSVGFSQSIKLKT